MSKICFETRLLEINEWRIIHVPNDKSLNLPTRGMTLVNGTINHTINHTTFQVELEPDGNGSHWFRLSDDLIQSTHLSVGDLVSVCIEPLQTWFEPLMPQDFDEALKMANLSEVWQSLTVKARWEWVRWIRFTGNPKTRQNRIEVTCSKLEAGKKRPCCFDLTRCTETAVSKSGVLNHSNSESDDYL